MTYFRSLNLKTKLIFVFLLIGLVPTLFLSVISTKNSTDDAENKVYNQLHAINQIKRKAIETYFDEREGDMSVLVNIADTLRQQAFAKLKAVQDLKRSQLHEYLSNNQAQLDLLASQQYVQQALRDMSQQFNRRSRWQKLLDDHDQSFKPLLTYFNWYDFFLINNQGDIVYSVTRESDLRQNLAQDLAQSSFNQAFSKAKSNQGDSVTFADFKPYGPSNNDPAAFAVKAVEVDGKRIGYIAYQQPLEKINEILGHRVGMGNTGESYLVGQDRLMRSDSYLNPEQFSVKASFANNNKVNTVAVESALAGEQSTAVIQDYNDNPVISSWHYINVSDDVRWAIISEIDVAEAFNPFTTSNQEFYKSYIEKYGYYDLFLINPNGHIFYTVTKEADFNTNILNGKYQDSNLGTLVKQLEQDKRFSFVDFAPYAPSNGDPAAFIGQPLLDNSGNVALYIALQLPLEGIVNIMGVRDGMGETGESYLVGQDLKMRSDSFLDPQGHSVKASFAGTVQQNGVDTEAVRRALSGDTGTDIIIDYNGNPVLSSFDVIEFDGFKWAVLSEVDEAEALASVKENTWFAIILMLITTVAVVLVGYIVAVRIASPITGIAKVATKVSQGDLTSEVYITASDEIGDLQLAMQQMVGNLRNMVNSIATVAEQQASTSEELAAITTQTNSTVGSQQSISEQLATAMQEMGSTVNEVASNTANTSNAVDEIQNKVMLGSDKLNTTFSAILTMSDQIQSSEQTVQQVRDDFEQVNTVLQVIKGIADQTNLLALNAAIEAARAGDQGRGFAVVADEVRQLAQRTQDSTTQIDKMIETIIAGADSSVAVMAKSVQQANAVQNQASEVTEINQVIAAEIQNISGLSAQIATAAEEQSVVIDEILENVEQLNTGVGETKGATDNIAQSSVEMAKLATDLEKETSFFNV